MKRTKTLVFDAFFQMVQSSRYDELKIKDIIANANIGRSTFYEHFSDKDDLLSQSLEYPLSIFAASLTGDVKKENLLFVLSHFWERRLFARVILKHPTRDVVDGCLRKLISSNLTSSRLIDKKGIQAHASFLSSGLLSVLNEWLTGRLSLSVEEMMEQISTYSLKI